MFQVNAQRYVRTVRSLLNLTIMMRQFIMEGRLDPDRAAPKEHREVLAKGIREYADDCAALGARAARDSAARVADQLEEADLLWRDIDLLITSASSAFFDEMGRFHAMFLDEQESEAFNAVPADCYGARSVTAYPSAAFDMEEACKCWALGRGTACVFHLMRVLECVVEAIWRSLPGNQTKPKPSGGWGEFKREITDYLNSPPWGTVHKPSDWLIRKRFYDDVHGDLTAVSNAWRNPTMHPERIYTTERAKEILDATRALVRDAAEHVDETGAYTP